MFYIKDKKYRTHENCVHYQDGWCNLNKIKVDPKGSICPGFTPKFKKLDSNLRITKSLELKILEDKLNNIQRRIRYLKGKINNLN
jgi:hypothetical protein